MGLFPEIEPFINSSARKAMLLGLLRAGKTGALVRAANKFSRVLWVSGSGGVPELRGTELLSQGGLGPWVEILAAKSLAGGKRCVLTEGELLTLFSSEADRIFPGLGHDLFPSYLAYLRSERNEQVLKMALAARFLDLDLAAVHEIFAMVTLSLRDQNAWCSLTAMEWLCAEVRNHQLTLGDLGYPNLQLIAVDDAQMLSGLEARLLSLLTQGGNIKVRATIGQLQSMGIHEGRLGSREVHSVLAGDGYETHTIKSVRWLGRGHVSALKSMNPEIGRAVHSAPDPSESLTVNVVLHKTMEECLPRVLRDIRMARTGGAKAEEMVVVCAIPYYVQDVADMLSGVGPLDFAGEGVGMNSAAVSVAHAAIRLAAGRGDKFAQQRILSLWLEGGDLLTAGNLMDARNPEILASYLEEMGVSDDLILFVDAARAGVVPLTEALRGTPKWPSGDALSENSLDRWAEWVAWEGLTECAYDSEKWAPWLSGPPPFGPRNPESLLIVAGGVAVPGRFKEAHFIGFSGGVVPPPYHPEKTVDGGFAHTLTRVNGLMTCHHIETIESPSGEEIKLYPSKYLRGVTPVERSPGMRESDAPTQRKGSKFRMRFR